MAQRPVSVDEIANLARELTPADRARLIERVTAELERDIGPPGAKRSLRGLWAGHGFAPSADEIDVARREVWQDFPRDLI